MVKLSLIKQTLQANIKISNKIIFKCLKVRKDIIYESQQAYRLDDVKFKKLRKQTKKAKPGPSTTVEKVEKANEIYNMQADNVKEEIVNEIYVEIGSSNVS